MRRLTILISILTTLACQNQHSKTIAPNEVSETVEAWLGLWETYDLDLLDEIFWVDDRTTYFSSEKEGLIESFDSLIPHHEGFGFVSGGKTPDKSLWLEETKLEIYNTTALVSAIWLFGERTAPRDSIQKGPVTFVLIRNDSGEVRIAHTHFANY